MSNKFEQFEEQATAIREAIDEMLHEGEPDVHLRVHLERGRFHASQLAQEMSKCHVMEPEFCQPVAPKVEHA